MEPEKRRFQIHRFILGCFRQRYENSRNDFAIRRIYRELRQIGGPKSEPRSGSRIWELPFGPNLRNVRVPVRREPIRQGFSRLRTKENTGLIGFTRMGTLFSGFNSILSGPILLVVADGFCESLRTFAGESPVWVDFQIVATVRTTKAVTAFLHELRYQWTKSFYLF